MIRYSLALVCLSLVACADVVVGDGGTGGTGIEDAGADADVCDTVVCDCDIDEDCEAHEICDATSQPGRVCVCAPAYADNGGGCVFAGAPLAPGFDDAAPWTTTGAAVLDPDGTGSDDPGQVTWLAGAVCDGSSVRQTFAMPSYERAEPLAIQMTHQGRGDFYEPRPDLGINGKWVPVENRSTFATTEQCLGASGFGGDVEFRIEGYTSGCPSTDGVEELIVDRLEVVRAEDIGLDCPAPGSVRDGDFEGDGSAWTGIAPSDGFAGVEDGVGTGGSRAARLRTATLCSAPSIAGVASWPLPSTVPSPALQFVWNGTAGRNLFIHSGGLTLAQLTATGATGASTVCLLPAIQGTAQDIKFALPSTAGFCADPDVRDFVLDDAELISEPGCGDEPLILDGDFEKALDGTLATGWILGDQEPRATAAVVGGGAQSGNASLLLAVRQECTGASAETTIVVPTPDVTGGPALKFFYRVGNNPETTTSSFPGDGPLPEGGLDFAEVTVCLDPNDATKPLNLRFVMSPGGGTCADTFPEEQARIDNVRVSTDPGCPIE